MLNLARRLWKEEEGQGMVEYGLIIAVVAVIALVGLTAMGGQLSDFFDTLKDKIAAPTT